MTQPYHTWRYSSLIQITRMFSFHRWVLHYSMQSTCNIHLSTHIFRAMRKKWSHIWAVELYQAIQKNISIFFLQEEWVKLEMTLNETIEFWKTRVLVLLCIWELRRMKTKSWGKYNQKEGERWMGSMSVTYVCRNAILKLSCQ